jgi:hypothetical protein
MLKYINYQLDPDDAVQAQLEQDISAEINQRFKSNIAAFSQHIPSVVSMLEQHAIQQYSVFCTQKGELNIVDFATGRVWYTETPFAEVVDEVQSFCAQAPYIDLREGNADSRNRWPTETLPSNVDVVMMFGLGLGYQLNELLNNVRVKYLIVYEPNLDTLLCSMQANDWGELFNKASALGTQIFLQLDNDGSSIQEDIHDLLRIENLTRIHIYRHYFHSRMDAVINFLMSSSDSLIAKPECYINTAIYENGIDYIAERSGNVLGNFFPEEIDIAKDVYQNNLSSLKKYYPEIHESVISHVCNSWFLSFDINDKPNIFHLERKAFFYNDVDFESESLVSYFINSPYKDDVILGQKVPDKLRHYVHFSHLEKIQPIVNKKIKMNSILPCKVDSLIIFGVGLGRHIEVLLNQREVESLYVCEPNLDFFVSSLHIIDWASIFLDAEKKGKSVYLNLGGDGASYFNDFMSQFYRVGAYSIANTYMLDSYYNIAMKKAIDDLRSELRVVLALGEYYDHVRYGISHTYKSIDSNHKFLKEEISEFSNSLYLSMPVFMVGNGPSLDDAIENLKNYRDKVVLISCGTALFSLYKHGIKPDFHAEIEQNRSTFYWINQVDDKNWLKSIYLLSVNGIHPDTADLFKDTFLCFKSGESSTYFFQSGLAEFGYKTTSLSYAYPTVSNLVLNFVIKLGFRCVYLFGVDLGYADIKHHHSRSSAYYRADGTEVYDYKNVHGGGIPSRGNFLPYVYTKPEFDVSRKLLEQAIKNSHKSVEFYNCSNGVRIEGASPLRYENILLPEVNFDKDAEFKSFVSKAFYGNVSSLATNIFSNIDFDAFSESMVLWKEISSREIKNLNDASEFIKAQWYFIRERSKNKRDPTFFLFYGTTNYFCSVMTKLISSAEENDCVLISDVNKVKDIWASYMDVGAKQFQQNPLELDAVDVSYLFKS